MSSACGGEEVVCYGPRRPKQEWPEIGHYFLQCGAAKRFTMLAPGIDPVSYRRSFDPPDPPQCIDPDLAREHFLVTMTNTPASDPPIRARTTLSITWSSEDAYVREANAFVAEQYQRFAEVAKKLGAGDARPKLELEIEDHRAVRTPLPVIETGNK